jgi:transcriptional regulator with XRE-family HTH domain
LLGKRLRALRSARGLRQEAIALVTTLIAGQDKAALKKLQIFIKEMLGQTAQADQGGERAS